MCGGGVRWREGKEQVEDLCGLCMHGEKKEGASKLCMKNFDTREELGCGSDRSCQ